MDSSVSEGAASLQPSQPSMQKKKKSKNKKGPKGATPVEVLTLMAETENVKRQKVNADSLSEKLAQGLHLSSSISSASEVNDRRSSRNKLANGTAEELSISESCCHQVNGHDCNVTVALAAVNATGSESNPAVEKQHVKKTKSKNKLKNKESVQENCHDIGLVENKGVQQQESYKQPLQNGFFKAEMQNVEMQNVEMEGSEGQRDVALSREQNEKENKNIKEEIESEGKLEGSTSQVDQKQPKEEPNASIPASTEKTTTTTTPSTFKQETATVSLPEKEIVSPTLDLSNVRIEYKEYESELQMHDIMRLIQAELSEPYSIYTYRYFIYNWPKLCFLAAHGNEYVGAIVCKLDRHRHMNRKRGYIAMLAVRKEYRKLKIGTTLVQKAIEAMLADNADEVVLETEMRNVPALRLYENLGFVRDKRLFRYYLNGVDALRLKLWFR